MYLHTILPLETVYQGIDEASHENRKVMEYMGITLEVEKQTAGSGYRILRILSSNAFDYLRSDLQPGTIIMEK